MKSDEPVFTYPSGTKVPLRGPVVNVPRPKLTAEELLDEHGYTVAGNVTLTKEGWDEIRTRLVEHEADYQALWDKLRKTEVVAEYAQHYAACQFLESGIGHPMPCTCGLSEAKAALEGK